MTLADSSPTGQGQAEEDLLTFSQVAKALKIVLNLP